MARNKKSRLERFKSKPKGMPGSQRGVFLDPEIVTSDAFASLSGAEILLLIGFHRRKRYKKSRNRQKRQYFLSNYTNLTEIVYHLDAMMWETDTSKQGALNARKTLMEHGFVNLSDQTDWGNYSNNRWEICDRFLRWHPDPEQRKKNGFREHGKVRKKRATSGSYGASSKQSEPPVLDVVAVSECFFH